MVRDFGHSAEGANSGWTRRKFVAASGAAALIGPVTGKLARAKEGAVASTTEAIDFPSSYLYCAPTKSGIWVRVQMECLGTLKDVANGESNEFVMGVMAKTGLVPVAGTRKMAPGYDYTIIFSKTHVFTKRSHSSAYLNNPTVLELKDFGEANWRFHRVAAEPLMSIADIRKAIESWRRMTAKTVFTSADGKRQFSIEYPVKWADYSLKTEGFRIETGPVFLMNPDKLRVGSTPAFEDFQWAHVDFHSFDRVRCLLEQPTSILADATFTPPAEDGREHRATVALTDTQIKEINDALFSGNHISLPRASLESLLTTDQYSRANDVSVSNELYALTG